MSKKWGDIGAWAADAERAEEEEREAAASAGTGGVAGSQNFPSLKEAVSAKPKKKKMSLMEFTAGSFPGSGAGGGLATEHRGLTPDEMFRLPTGPKERSAEEMQYNRLGGGFSNYGGGRSGPPPHRSRDRDDGDGSWGGGRRSYGEFDEERRGGPRSRVSDFDQPSRADEVDNWASMKKSLSVFDSGRQNRYGSLGGGGGGGGVGGSRADEVDNWMAGKKPLHSRSSTFGSGFRDSGPEPDRRTRGTRDGDRERPRLVLDPPRGNGSLSETEPAVKTNKPNPFGAARPREEVLAEKGLDWKKLDSEIEAKKTSRPTSAHSSRPNSAQSSRSEGPAFQVAEAAVKVRPKVNPFGDAKPREVLLEERGQDWRKIDLELEHRRVDRHNTHSAHTNNHLRNPFEIFRGLRYAVNALMPIMDIMLGLEFMRSPIGFQEHFRPETMEEKLLKEEMDNLKKELKQESAVNSNKKSGDEADGDQTSTQAMLLQKERELEILTRDLDDKVRFGQKAIERPGSAAGKTTGFPDRPPSQSGSFEDSRSVEFADRPRSRGTGDMWMRSNEDRRPFQGSRDREWFQNSRESDRSRARERW